MPARSLSAATAAVTLVTTADSIVALTTFMVRAKSRTVVLGSATFGKTISYATSTDLSTAAKLRSSKRLRLKVKVAEKVLSAPVHTTSLRHWIIVCLMDMHTLSAKAAPTLAHKLPSAASLMDAESAQVSGTLEVAVMVPVTLAGMVVVVVVVVASGSA